MVLFGFIFFVSVAGLLAARAMDIECEFERKPRIRKASHFGKRSGFPAEPMGMRHI